MTEREFAFVAVSIISTAAVLGQVHRFAAEEIRVHERALVQSQTESQFAAGVQSATRRRTWQCR
jgi:hypothetical protein